MASVVLVAFLKTNHPKQATMKNTNQKRITLFPTSTQADRKMLQGDVPFGSAAEALDHKASTPPPPNPMIGNPCKMLIEK